MVGGGNPKSKARRNRKNASKKKLEKQKDDDQQEKTKGTKTPVVEECESEEEHDNEQELVIDKPSSSRHTHRQISKEEAECEAAEAEKDRAIADVMGKREFKLASALTILTFEGFKSILWGSLEYTYRRCHDDLYSFKYELFDALACFLWNLYDEEDIENFAFTEDISHECERIWRKLVHKEGKFELNSRLLDVSKHRKLREQDVCNIFKWYNEKKSPSNDELTESSNFDCEVRLHKRFPRYRLRDFEKCVWRARIVMLAYDKLMLDPKGRVKQQLRMELNDSKCFCVVDALYMESWKHINFQKLEDAVFDHDRFEALVAHIHKVFYELVVIRTEYLHRCENLVTYPLSGNMFGSWDSEVQQVVKYADLKRRSEGRRFIGTDHLVFCLHQMLVPDDQRANKNSKVLSSGGDKEEKHKDETVYHLYRKAYKIATQLGDETIGVEHLYVAITSTNDDESSWKDSVERVRMVKTKREGNCKEGEDPHTNELWIGLLPDHTKRVMSDWAVLDVVKKIKSDTCLQNAINAVLLDGPARQQMSQGEMIDSLKKYIEIQNPS